MFCAPLILRILKRGACGMRFSFCKKSLFSILFLVFFFLGTICGILLLRFILICDNSWMTAYCLTLESSGPSRGLMSLWFHLWPFLSALAIYFLPHKDKLFLVLFFLRGCICAYTIGAYYAMGVPLMDVVLKNLLIFPVFFAFCRRLWSSDNNL